MLITIRDLKKLIIKINESSSMATKPRFDVEPFQKNIDSTPIEIQNEDEDEIAPHLRDDGEQQTVPYSDNANRIFYTAVDPFSHQFSPLPSSKIYR